MLEDIPHQCVIVKDLIRDVSVIVFNPLAANMGSLSLLGHGRGNVTVFNDSSPAMLGGMDRSVN